MHSSYLAVALNEMHDRVKHHQIKQIFIEAAVLGLNKPIRTKHREPSGPFSKRHTRNMVLCLNTMCNGLPLSHTIIQSQTASKQSVRMFTSSVHSNDGG